jgi:hypothetical protein
VKERDEKRGRVLFKDPRLPWPGDFPYERLDRSLQEVGHPGVSPDSTGTEVKDALFDLMAKGAASPEARLAWDELRHSERRLVLDFLMYEFEAEEGSGWSEAVWELPMPVWMPDFRELADGEPEYEKAVPVPASFDSLPALGYARIDENMLAAPPVDIGPVSVNDVAILGEDYDK